MTTAPESGDEIRICIANRHKPVPEKTIRDFCRKWKLNEFRFYGSVMRDDFRPDSDIDVLIEFLPGANPSFSDLCDMQDELEGLLNRKVDLTDRSSVDQSENYIRRKGVLSGEPPVFRQMSYLLDMLISSREIGKILQGDPPEIIDVDDRAFHALSYTVGCLVASAGKVEPETRNLLPEIPWEMFDATGREFEEDLFHRNKDVLKEIAGNIVPRIIPLLVAVIPPEDDK